MSMENSIQAKLREFLLRREVLLSLLVIGLLYYLFSIRSERIIFTILIEFSIFAIITLSLNLETGHTGIPQFGRVAAVIIGAFAVGAIPGRIMAFFMDLQWGWDYTHDTINFRLVPQINDLMAQNWPLALSFFIGSIIIAGLCGAGMGWLISRPAIRLKEAYLGISLLAFGDFFMWVGHNWKGLVGGSTPVNVPDPFRMFGGDRFMVIVVVILLLAVLTYIYLEKLTKSPFGRNLKMVRDNEVSAAAAGINVIKIRTQSLVIGSALAAIGGGLYVLYVGSVASIGFTKLTFTFWPWAFMMLGGIGSNVGVVLGVMLLTIFRTMIIIFRNDWFGFLLAVGIDPTWLEFTLMGGIIIVVILFLPYGLVPEKVEPTLPADRLKKIVEQRQ